MCVDVSESGDIIRMGGSCEGATGEVLSATTPWLGVMALIIGMQTETLVVLA